MYRPPDYKAAMAGKRSARPKDTSAPIRGRPPMPPQTAFARWLRERGRTAKWAADEMIALAKQLGLPRGSAPKVKTLLDSVNGKHRPPLETVLMVRYLTDGAVDLDQWIKRRRAP